MRNPRGVLLVVAVAVFLTSPGLAQAKQKYKKTVEQYKVPDVTLLNQDGERVRLLDLMNSGKPVLVDFVYATCTTICPVLSAGFANFQKKMGDQVESVQLVSFTIDPEHDTPELMAEYLQRYRARPGWDFFTGSREDIDRVMHAFDAYVDNKMDHYPVTILRGPTGDEWVRIYGLLGTSDLMREYKALVE